MPPCTHIVERALSEHFLLAALVFDAGWEVVD
jgi:hypothetical protein